ncbi:MAG: DUF2177 family protein [Pseudomonadota bacterium]|nr:DUF2177 family protein [Pseudomonadota bacterium]
MLIPLIAYALSLVVLLVLDLFWLLGPGRPFYVAEIGGLLRSQPQLGASIAFYLLYAAGLTYFGVMPSLKTSSAGLAMGQGALFGLMAYATYDLTNLAVLNGFTLRIALIDMAWGSVLSGVTAWIVTKLLMKFISV